MQRVPLGPRLQVQGLAGATGASEVSLLYTPQKLE